MDKRKLASDSVAQWCESAEGTCGSAALPNEVAPDDCCSESNLFSAATKKYKSNNYNDSCTKRDEQAPSISSAPKSDKHVVSPIGADEQSLGTDDANVMLEPPAYNDLDIHIKSTSSDDVTILEEETVVNTERSNTDYTADSIVEMPTCSHSALHYMRKYRILDTISLQDENEDDTTAAGSHGNYEARRLLPSVGFFNNIGQYVGVENIPVDGYPDDDILDYFISCEEDDDSSESSYINEDVDDHYDDLSSFTFEENDDYNIGDEYTRNKSTLRFMLQKAKPSYACNLTKELIRRENGLSRDGRRFSHNSLVFGFNSSRNVVERMKLSGCLRIHTGSVTSLHFDRFGELLCSGSVDKRIIVWNWACKKPKIVLDSGHTDNIFETKFLESSGHLDIVSACEGGEIRRSIISSGGGDPETTLLYRHDGPVHKIVTNPFNSLEMFSVGEDGHIRFKDLRSNDPVSSICEVKNQWNETVILNSIAHHPSSTQICASGTDNCVHVYDKRKMTETMSEMCPLHLKETKFFEITSAVYNNTGTEVLASYSNAEIYLFSNVEYKTGDYLHRYIGHSNYKTSRKDVRFFGPNSDYVISGSDCGNIFFWHKNSAVIVNYMRGDIRCSVDSLEQHPMIPVLATSGFDHNIKLFTPCSPTYPPNLSRLEACADQNLRNSSIQNRWAYEDFKCGRRN